MGGLMRPIPYRELVLHSLAELRAKGSIFDIPVEHFHRPGPRRGEPLVGPAAGPHTQLAQNILCAYLYGLAGEFMNFYEQCPVLQAEPNTRASRLALCRLTSAIVKSTLKLLGIRTIEQM